MKVSRSTLSYIHGISAVMLLPTLDTHSGLSSFREGGTLQTSAKLLEKVYSLAYY